ncbi:hypothetical protein C2I18_04670 [Paenibacillus sp. PK3_47]|uniref:DUF5353 domain-containing protein n=1 Tax=Paenibacillus sp. PK3_47 TaxID=2072642 RepID=UPI00201D7870|nr:DUF5353 domain-containing protein [Paenibacillus sp. PK3_47]UQZ32912.1 hypothetical protein C2I18_04670 [Paenibacillus sp. PK3_47]
MEKHQESKLDRSQRKKVTLRPRRVDYPRRDRSLNEEYAAEVSPVPVRAGRAGSGDAETGDSSQARSGSKGLGYTGLALGIASLFMWSIILGPAAAVLGYYAYARGQKTTGAWAMGLGIVSTLSYFIMIPFAR